MLGGGFLICVVAVYISARGFLARQASRAASRRARRLRPRGDDDCGALLPTAVRGLVS